MELHMSLNSLPDKLVFPCKLLLAENSIQNASFFQVTYLPQADLLTHKNGFVERNYRLMGR